MRIKHSRLASVFLLTFFLGACVSTRSVHNPGSRQSEEAVIPSATLSIQPLPQISLTSTGSQLESLPSSRTSTGEIAYISNRSGLAEIWFLDLTTGSERQLTETDCSSVPVGGYVPEWYVAGVQGFVWSPDGKKIAYLATCTSVGHLAQLHVVNLETGDIVSITYPVVDAHSYPSWDSLGNRIIFARSKTPEYEVYVASVSDGWEIKPLTGTGWEGGSFDFPTWSPTGNHIAYRGPFVGQPGVGWRTFVSIVDIEGNHLSYEPKFEDEYRSRDGMWIAEPRHDGLVWSSNGQYLVIATVDGYGPASLKLVELKEQVATIKSSIHQYHPESSHLLGPGFYSPVFSSDSETLYFVSLQPDAIDVHWPFGVIYRIQVQSLLEDSFPSIQTISPKDQLSGFPSLSPDGEWLIYTVKIEEANEIWIQTVNGAHRQQLIGDGFVNTQAAWRPLGQ